MLYRPLPSVNVSSTAGPLFHFLLIYVCLDFLHRVLNHTGTCFKLIILAPKLKRVTLSCRLKSLFCCCIGGNKNQGNDLIIHLKMKM